MEKRKLKIKHAFAVQRRSFTRENEHLLEKYLTAAQIDRYIEMGYIVDMKRTNEVPVYLVDVTPEETLVEVEQDLDEEHLEEEV